MAVDKELVQVNGERRVVVLPPPDASFCAWQWQVIALVRGNVMP